ncbi:hypothetical protein DENSPDRAFT_875101 [Dentipellis sp. KUC8613]|nr:hypothetical protein DENSPDRAFT_875101 [Dentipellis sp. KUC8613]
MAATATTTVHDSSSGLRLAMLNDDVLILILYALPVRDILSMRKTCRRFALLSRQHALWTHACLSEVLTHNLPFPRHRALASLSQDQLERLTVRAIHFQTIWDPVPKATRRAFTFEATRSYAVGQIQFIPGHDERYLAVVTHGIWSAINIWDIGPTSTGPARRVVEWSPQGATLSGLVVNSEPDCDGTLAVTLHPTGRPPRIEVLSLRPDPEGPPESMKMKLETIASMESASNTALLEGELIAFSKDDMLIELRNYKTKYFALLGSSSASRANHLLYIVLSHHTNTVEVFRTYNIDEYTLPSLLPPTTSPPDPHLPFCDPWYMNWADALAVTPQMHTGNIGFLRRMTQDNPWSEATGTIELQEFRPGALPRGTSPATTYELPVPRGSLRCRTVCLGPCGTLAYVVPRPHDAQGLTALDVHAQDTALDVAPPARERLVLARAGAGECAVWANAEADDRWTALDYDEASGRVALGSGYGRLTVLLL